MELGNNDNADRGKEYGDYSEMAKIIQELKSTMRHRSNYGLMSDAQRESLDLIATKIGRILTGNHNNLDSWQDIEGYARLISNIIIKNENRTI